MAKELGRTSDSGLSQIRTQYNKPLHKGQDLQSQYNSYNTFLTSQRGKPQSLYKEQISWVYVVPEVVILEVVQCHGYLHHNSLL